MSDCACSGDQNLFRVLGSSGRRAIADRAARKLSQEGVGKMFCLAGVGGALSGIMETTRAAGDVLALDGVHWTA